ncbi:hypothetical protein CYMTET_39383 [Cymbomonas tetramitiformis]|uniref:Uncharacterized protein n=1 Tax=Cymbomonas tetramitiformis TaxID=36881 RepID=A0AAE0F5N4_9CHLO|nr:hypothetical protein CYMTET_39383 [Cymbomonas tetramitiformis]
MDTQGGDARRQAAWAEGFQSLEPLPDNLVQAKSAEPEKLAELAPAEVVKTDAEAKENPIYEEFKAIFDKFKQAEEAQAEGEGEEEMEEAEEEKKPAKKGSARLL